MPIQNQMMNDNEARPLRSCLSRHDASNLGDLRYSLLVKIDEDEANGMLLSIQTGLCYLWLYRVVRLNLAYYVIHACRLPIKGGKIHWGGRTKKRQQQLPSLPGNLTLLINGGAYTS